MHFTPILAVAGLAAAAPFQPPPPSNLSGPYPGLKYGSPDAITNETAPFHGLKHRSAGPITNSTVLDGFTNETAPYHGLKQRSASPISKSPVLNGFTNDTAPYHGLKYRSARAITNSSALDTASYENVDISNLSIEEKLAGNTLNVESIASVYFNLDGNITCQADNPGTSGTVFGCGSTPYSFGLVNGTTTQFALRIYHDLGNFAGRWGQGEVETYCHAGGSSDAGSYEVCVQVSPATIVIN